jgi:hypothetical protein
LLPEGNAQGKSFLKDVRFAIGLAVGLAILVIILASVYEYVPSNWKTTRYNVGNITVFVTHPSNLLIPVRNIFSDKTFFLKVALLNDSSDYNIDFMKLSGSSDPILTFDDDGFARDHSFPPYSNEATNPLSFYQIALHAQHFGEVRNISSPYNINIVYHRANGESILNSNDTRSNTLTENILLPLDMPVRTMDLSSFVYLFVVFIGVLVSRYTKKIYSVIKSDKQQLTDEEKVRQNTFNQHDLVWIFASGIITLLIFSSFQEQVDLQSSLIINISLSFTFGFGFDKLIETATFLGKESKQV